MTDQEQGPVDAGEDRSQPQQQQQQQPQPLNDGHGGQGSDSAMKHMRVWEQRRASNSGGKRRSGPN
jgi:hypothetical protein